MPTFAYMFLNFPVTVMLKGDFPTGGNYSNKQRREKFVLFCSNSNTIPEPHPGEISGESLFRNGGSTEACSLDNLLHVSVCSAVLLEHIMNIPGSTQGRICCLLADEADKTKEEILKRNIWVLAWCFINFSYNALWVKQWKLGKSKLTKSENLLCAQFSSETKFQDE